MVCRGARGGRPLRVDRRGILKRANADMTGRNPGKDRSGQGGGAQDPFAGGDHSEAAGGGDPQGMHPLADTILAQHRAERRAAVTAARVAGAPRAFELDINASGVGRDVLAKENGPAISEIGEVAKLVAGVGLGNRFRARRQCVAGKDPLCHREQNGRIESQISRQRFVEHCHARITDRLWQCRREKLLRQPGIGIVEPPACIPACPVHVFCS